MFDGFPIGNWCSAGDDHLFIVSSNIIASATAAAGWLHYSHYIQSTIGDAIEHLFHCSSSRCREEAFRWVRGEFNLQCITNVLTWITFIRWMRMLRDGCSAAFMEGIYCPRMINGSIIQLEPLGTTGQDDSTTHLAFLLPSGSVLREFTND